MSVKVINMRLHKKIKNKNIKKNIFIFFLFSPPPPPLLLPPPMLLPPSSSRGIGRFTSSRISEISSMAKLAVNVRSGGSRLSAGEEGGEEGGEERGEEGGEPAAAAAASAISGGGRCGGADVGSASLLLSDKTGMLTSGAGSRRGVPPLIGVLVRETRPPLFGVDGGVVAEQFQKLITFLLPVFRNVDGSWRVPSKLRGSTLIQVARSCSKVFHRFSASLVRVGDVQGVSRRHAVRGKKVPHM